jgi:hypothetical protein
MGVQESNLMGVQESNLGVQESNPQESNLATELDVGLMGVQKSMGVQKPKNRWVSRNRSPEIDQKSIT